MKRLEGLREASAGMVEALRAELRDALAGLDKLAEINGDAPAGQLRHAELREVWTMRTALMLLRGEPLADADRIALARVLAAGTDALTKALEPIRPPGRPPAPDDILDRVFNAMVDGAELPDAIRAAATAAGDSEGGTRQAFYRARREAVADAENEIRAGRGPGRPLTDDQLSEIASRPFSAPLAVLRGWNEIIAEAWRNAES